MTSLTKTRVLGGSLAVTIPIELVRKEGLKEDELVEIEVKKAKKDYFGALKGIGSYKREEDRMKDRE
ncbi:MAG TPA: AbrB/MazE/SpoVT family DNA-binding domain-containing protein [Candidatus Nanoarchaeia archaeon]|nr:AbrB/MazE/SpoVT family DNA-binding domain-containing protein [Candidatus Nanoarchaeia archaeon]